MSSPAHSPVPSKPNSNQSTHQKQIDELPLKRTLPIDQITQGFDKLTKKMKFSQQEYSYDDQKTINPMQLSKRNKKMERMDRQQSRQKQVQVRRKEQNLSTRLHKYLQINKQNKLQIYRLYKFESTRQTKMYLLLPSLFKSLQYQLDINPKQSFSDLQAQLKKKKINLTLKDLQQILFIAPDLYAISCQQNQLLVSKKGSLQSQVRKKKKKVIGLAELPLEISHKNENPFQEKIIKQIKKKQKLIKDNKRITVQKQIRHQTLWNIYSFFEKNKISNVYYVTLLNYLEKYAKDVVYELDLILKEYREWIRVNLISGASIISFNINQFEQCKNQQKIKKMKFIN